VWAKDTAILKAQGDSPCNIYRLHCTTLQVSTVIGAEKNAQKGKGKLKKKNTNKTEIEINNIRKMNTSKESFRPSFLVLWKWVCSNVSASYG